MRWIGLVLLESIVIFVLQNYCHELGYTHSEYKRFQENLEANITKEIVAFPIPIEFQARISYTDSYLEKRSDGLHKACDIMDKENTSGEIPILSMTDGVVTNLGWLYLGGYRIGVTSESGLYYYYAHLHSYAEGLEVGDRVVAGQLLGFMGNTGQGEEGMTNQFDVHLHVAIYYDDIEGVEKNVNLYPFLRKLQE